MTLSVDCGGMDGVIHSYQVAAAMTYFVLCYLDETIRLGKLVPMPIPDH